MPVRKSVVLPMGKHETFEAAKVVGGYVKVVPDENTALGALNEAAAGNTTEPKQAIKTIEDTRWKASSPSSATIGKQSQKQDRQGYCNMSVRKKSSSRTRCP